MGVRETPRDIARNLERMTDIIMVRVFEHQKLIDLSKGTKIPVINALSDWEHPCQAMGDEKEKSKRLKIFPPYQVNSKLMKLAKKDAIFVHCLPAYRGYEVTDKIIDGKHSVVFDEAENRLHVQKAIMLFLLDAKATKRV